VAPPTSAARGASFWGVDGRERLALIVSEPYEDGLLPDAREGGLLVLRKLMLSLAAGATWLIACPTYAQTAPAGVAGTESLGEIVVTAQRREQRLQDVPIAVQVLSTDLVQKHAADDMAQMDKWVPGLVVSGDSPTQPHFQLRGIGASDFGVGTDPAVGVYVDGVYAARSGASFLAFDDVERIEVIKGPQGTLLGRSSAAGAISIVTKKPSDVLEGSLDVRLGNEGKQRYEGMLNVPLTEGMALRFNAVSNKSDGFLADAATGQKLNPEKNWAGRAAFRWDIDSDTKLLLAWNHDSVNQLARVAIGLIPAPPGGFGPGSLPPPYDPTGASFLNPITAPIYNDEVGNTENRNFNDFVMSFERHFGNVDFVSTTDWRQFRTSNLESETGTDGLATYFDTDNIEHNAAWYQEFKLSGKTARADWVAGVSYSSEHAQQTSAAHTYTDGIDTLLNNVGGVPGGVYGPTSAFLAANGIPISLLGLPWEEDMIDDGRFKSLGVFGDVIWHLTDAVDLTTGVRYSHDTKDFTWLAPSRAAPQLDANIAALAQLGIDVPPIPNLVFSEPPGRQGVPYSTSGSWSDVSPRIVLDYKLNPNAMFYASVAKGFTPGGFDAVQINGKYTNEDVWNYEVGFKTVFPDAHLLVNGALYDYVYRNKQALILTGVSGSVVPEYTVSSSDQKAYGLDLDVRWQPVTSLTLGLTSAYIDSTYTKFLSPALGGTDLAGEPTGEPFWSFAASADYVITLADHGSVDVFVSHSYRGARRCNDESQATRACLPQASFPLGVAQNQTDARIGWRSAQGKWGVSLYGTNLFDKRYVTGINNITEPVFVTPIASVNAPRRYGLELHAGF
jgi:iron complex outermembrane receptor protein